MVPQGFGWTDLPNPKRNRMTAVEIHWLDAQGQLIMVRDPADGHFKKAVHVFQTERPNDWFQIYPQSVQAPAGAATAAVLLRSYSMGEHWFDDVQLIDPVAGNIVQNSGFELGSNGMPTAWTTNIDHGSATFIWQTAWGRNGTPRR
jgi:hypothetical protein